MPYPKLSTPPIIESIFLVRFKEILEKEQIENFCKNEFISSRYRASESEDRKKEGTYILRSLENNKALRVNLDSLSLHNLTYSPFEEIYEEFKAMIEIVTSLTKSLTLEQFSLRYLNLIKLEKEEEKVNLFDYLTFKIETPFSISNFFIQFFVDNEKDNDMQGIIVGAIRHKNESIGDNDLGILLDINVRKNIDLSSVEEDTYRNVLFMMRDFKNQLFFKSVQSKVLETYT